MMTSAGIFRIIYDHVGTPRMVIDQQSSKTISMSAYTAFGQPVLETQPTLLPFGFAGGIFDRDTGLVHFGARDYDPEVGRWLSKDPLGFEGCSTNLYSYAINDPINLKDPNGMLFGADNVIAIGIIIGAPALTQGIASGFTTLLEGGSSSDIASATIQGAISGASAGASVIGAVVFGAEAGLLLGTVAAGADILTTVANAPGALDNQGGADLSSGLSALLNPNTTLNKNSCQ